MKKRVFFKKGFQRKFIDEVKKKSKLTWKDLCKKLNLKYTTLSKSYRFEYCSLPLEIFKKMCKILEEKEHKILKKFNGETKDEIIIIGRKTFGESRKKLKEIKITFEKNDLSLDNSKVKFSNIDIKKRIYLPNKITQELAEEIGMHFGDGFLSEKRHDYRLKGNPKDEKEYYENYIKSLFKKLYNIEINLKESWKSFGFELHSQAYWEFKTKILNIKPGEKYKITIPEKLKVNNQQIICSFLRGLFDTDGHLRFKSQYGYKNYYPVIEISLTSKNLIKEVAEIFEMLGFNIWLGFNEKYGRISLSGIPNFKRYKKLIGWSSQKNLNRVNEWENQYPMLK